MVSFSPGGILYAADLQALADASVDRPRVKLIQQAAQNLSNNTDTPITFAAGSTDVDTHGLHSESVNNTRITFDRDGTWRMRCSLFMTFPGSGVTYVLLQLGIYLNGSIQVPRVRGSGPTTANISACHQASFEIEADAGQYVEMIGLQQASTTGTKATTVGGSFASTFEAIYMRERS